MVGFLILPIRLTMLPSRQSDLLGLFASMVNHEGCEIFERNPIPPLASAWGPQHSAWLHADMADRVAIFINDGMVHIFLRLNELTAIFSSMIAQSGQCASTLRIRG